MLSVDGAMVRSPVSEEGGEKEEIFPHERRKYEKCETRCVAGISPRDLGHTFGFEAPLEAFFIRYYVMRRETVMESIWKNILIVGASSGIGEALARQLANDDTRIALVSRRESELKRVAGELKGKAFVYPHDVTAYEEIPGLFQKIVRDLGGLDMVIYTAGVMPPIGENEYNFDKDLTIVEVNLLGAIAWLNEAAIRFGVAGAGSIVGVTSVAGDRGRRGQPVYCASKAAFNTYLEALRNRLAVKGVSVVTVKPGPVATPMTRGLDNLPMVISAEQAASGIINAVRRKKREVYVPGKWRPIMFILRHIPSILFQKMKI